MPHLCFRVRFALGGVIVPWALLCSSAWAQGDDAAGAPERTVASAASVDARAPEPREAPRVLVLDLECDDGLDRLGRLGTEALTHALSSSDALEVLSTADLRQMVELEAGRAAAGCDTTSCLTEIAGAMGARYVVFGSVSGLGSRYLMRANLFDAFAAQPVAREQARARDDAELDVVARQVAAKLAAAIDVTLEPVAERAPVLGTTLWVGGATGLAGGAVLFLAAGSLAAGSALVLLTASTPRGFKDAAFVAVLPAAALALGGGAVGVVSAVALGSGVVISGQE